MTSITSPKKIGILPNTLRDINLAYTQELANYLHSQGCSVFIETHHAPLPLTQSANLETICQLCDFVIFLGGDGTILQKIANCARHHVPLMGINLGSVGYLADVDKADGVEAVQRILDGHYTTDQRLLIQTTLQAQCYPALNDICIIKRDSTKLITLNVYVNHQYIDTYRGDGIIVSTPTGSTAYNMAAGGPIIKPDTQAMVMTPIAPYKIYSRPLVLSSDDTITIVCEETQDGLLSIDGTTQSLQPQVTIDRSPFNATILRTHTQNFYDVLRKKFFLS